MKQQFELRKVRDFGQIINDSFTFLKNNFKPLFKSLIIICGFMILIGIVSTFFIGVDGEDNLSYYLRGATIKTDPVLYILTVFAYAFIFILGQSFIQLVTICYISVYLERGNVSPSVAEVWGFFKYYFFRVLSSSFLLIILTFCGLIFCVVPGFYLYTVFALVTPIIVIENASFGTAFNKSFQLIKGNWWLLFGVIFIMTIIVKISEAVAGIPLTFFRLGGSLFGLGRLKIPLNIIYSVIKSILLFIYVLPALGVSFCYFSFSEEKEGLGLLSRIDKIGTAQNEQPELPTEEF